VSLKLSDTTVCELQIRARLGTTAHVWQFHRRVTLGVDGSPNARDVLLKPSTLNPAPETPAPQNITTLNHATLQMNPPTPEPFRMRAMCSSSSAISLSSSSFRVPHRMSSPALSTILAACTPWREGGCEGGMEGASPTAPSPRMHPRHSAPSLRRAHLGR